MTIGNETENPNFVKLVNVIYGI